MKPALKFLWLLLALSAAAGARAAPAPFLWEVHTAKATHYLLGSIHLLPPAAHPLPAALESAYAESEGIVLESDLATLSSLDTQKSMLAAARLLAPGGLKAIVPPPLYQELEHRAGDVGMPMVLCEGFKSWFCALSLEVFNFQREGFVSELGIDQYYYRRATAEKKSIRWLEAPAEHMKLFMEMPDSLAEQFLAATVEELTESGKAPADLLRIWRDGDVAAMDVAGRDFQRRHPKAYERLIGARNRAWIARLSALLAEDASLLVIVGAAHLAGPENLVDLLKARGFDVRPVAGPAQSAGADEARDANANADAAP